jgi:hypothetical protein
MTGSAGDLVERKARKTQAKAEHGSGWYAVLARVGLVAKGISYGLVGVLAIGVAVGEGGKATDRKGALQPLAHESWGRVVLVLLAAGFAAYAAWRLVQTFTERGDADDGEAKTWGKRAGYLGRAAVYAVLTWSTVVLLFGKGEQGASQTEQTREHTHWALSWPAGRYLVALAGAVIVGAGLWNAYRAFTQNFEDKWRGGMSATARCWGRRAGVAGHLARGVVFGLIGFFIAKAALDYDPKEAIGLDGALRKLAQADYGPWLLGVTAAGLVAYAVYCLFDARYRDVSVGD